MPGSTDEMTRGPLRSPVNAFLDAPNSIHNDSVATGLGLRGGTVAGSVHMDQFPPLLVAAFGQQWFETGSLSLRFVNPTTNGEPVAVLLGRPESGIDAQVLAQVEREDGMLVAEGTASVGISSTPTHLSSIDLRPDDSGALRILAGLEAGSVLVETTASVSLADAVSREQDGRITEPLPWYTGDSPWGGPIASPSQIVGLLWRNTTNALAERNGGAVGLFGAIEVRHLAGPVFADREYQTRSTAVAAGQSPRTEYLWFDSVATDDGGREVARMRMQLRWMKASSSHYAA